MGHKNPATTFIVYGGFSPDQQFEIIERLGLLDTLRTENYQNVIALSSRVKFMQQELLAA